MEKLAYILRDGSPFSAATISALLLEEFVHAQIKAALPEIKMAEKDCDTPMQGGLFLHADADFCPEELGQVAGNAKRGRLLSETGEELGYVSESGVLDTQGIAKLPTLVLHHARRLTPYNLSEVLSTRKKALLSRLREQGVFVECDQVTLSPLYTVGAGTFIARDTVLSGKGSIGRGCTLLGGRLHNVVLGDGVSVEKSVLTDCTVGAHSTVGPFAYLRPATEVGANCRIGDFVELKNAKIGDGTKVSHLTYVGDSDVGSGVNFGCGTVTSNYDGIHKYRTVIGDNVFIGCNTNLIAPVTVENNAYIAAGSTVTDRVPAAALAIARARQTNKENWVKKNKPELIK